MIQPNEIAKEMYLPTGIFGGDFYGRHEFDLVSAYSLSFPSAGKSIVIGNGNCTQSGLTGYGNNLGRSKLTITGSGVNMQIGSLGPIQLCKLTTESSEWRS